MKKPFKKLNKHANKSRKKHGFSGSARIHQVELSPETIEANRGLIQMAFDLNDAFELIIKNNDGVPEPIDRQCLRVTGLRLRDFNNFYIQFTTRMVLAKGVETEEEQNSIMTDFLDTFASFKPDGGEPDITHQTVDQHKEYLRCYDAFMDATDNTEKSADRLGSFVALTCLHAERLYGGKSNDN